MIVYYITILITAIVAWSAQLSKKRVLKTNSVLSSEITKKKPGSFFVFLTATILVLVAGLRWGVGTDYNQYAWSYIWYSRSTLSELLQFGEMGIRSISVISRYLYDDSATMFFIASILTIGLFVSTIAKNSSMFAFSILLFIFIGSWHGTFNGVRQYLACAVIFAGHRYMVEKRFLKYLLVVGIACLCHVTALIMLPLFFIATRKINFKQVVLLFLIVIVLGFSYDYIFKALEILMNKTIKMAPYMTTRVNILRVAVTFAPFALLFIRTKNNKMDLDLNFYLNMLIINAALMVATLNSAYLARVGIYTQIYTVVALPKILGRFDKKTAMLIKFVIIACYAVYWYIEVSGNPYLSNFHWIFER